MSCFFVSMSKEWFTVYEHNRRPSCTVSDLVMGNEYSFRVFSENICGLSDDPGNSKNTAGEFFKHGFTCLGLIYQPKPYKEKDMNRSPKFTAPLVDRSVIAGYTTAISCANKQGVLTLNIRKTSLFDGGRYSCRAINELGIDEVDCKLEVQGADFPLKYLEDKSS
ncbi:hypothetical protein XENOCAPTIV_021343 [Xenoophorus captivus]|uniref:Fibronectin type-III domain-containing protein n=1 Tax=Xenoophorus captivus TaxID=1517983 RepID=A0ABV0SGG8_9TELE